MPGAKVLKRQSNKIEKKVNAVTTNVAKHPKWNGAVLEATTQKRAFNGTIKDHIPASSNITKAVTQVDVGEVTADFSLSKELVLNCASKEEYELKAQESLAGYARKNNYFI